MHFEQLIVGYPSQARSEVTITDDNWNRMYWDSAVASMRDELYLSLPAKPVSLIAALQPPSPEDSALALWGLMHFIPLCWNIMAFQEQEINEIFNLMPPILQKEEHGLQLS